MAVDSSSSTSHSEPDQTSEPTPEPTPAASTLSKIPLLSSGAVVDYAQQRTGLLDQARAFLRSPEVVHQDAASVRSFLLAKGLTMDETERVISELPPVIPPRTYPQPPPSDLPQLLKGITYVMAWIAGGSVLLILGYMRFILPRLTKSIRARHALVTHQRGLLERLTASIDHLKVEQKSGFSLLPQPTRVYEATGFGECHTIAELRAKAVHDKVPSDISLLRCAIQELTANDGHAPTAESILVLVRDQKTSTYSDSDALYDILRSTPIFHEDIDKSNIARWSYVPPQAPAPPTIVAALSTLSAALPRTVSHHQELRAPARGLFQSLTDLTAFVTSHAYGLSFSARGTFGDAKISSGAEEVRKEIRALKGLVLNRRTFTGGRGLSPAPALAPGSMGSLVI